MNETTIDLRRIIKILKKRRNVIINIFLFCLIMATVATFLIQPTYEAETTLRVKQPKGLANSLLADLPVGNIANTKQLMSTYAEILKSRTVVEAVIDKMPANDEQTPKYEDMVKRIATVPVKDTELLKIQVQAPTPTEAQFLANTLVEKFNERMTFLIRSEQKSVREFIGQRMEESKQELEQAENTLQQYKRDQKIVAPADETKAVIDKLATIDKMAAENTVFAASVQAKLGSINQQLTNEKAGFVADSPLIQQYKSKLAELEVQLVSLKQKYTDKHPQVMTIRAAIDETRGKLEVEATRVVSADAPSMNPIHQELLKGKIQSEAEIAAAAAQQGAIQKVIAAGGKELTTLPAKEQGLVKVMRDATVAQDIYIMLARRHEEARISEVMEPADVQLIDPAVRPEVPIKPKRIFDIIIGALLGLFFGIAMAFIMEYLGRTIRNDEDVKYYLDLPVIGNIPDFNTNLHFKKDSRWSKIVSRLTGNKTQGRY